jgi:hypothetical protein
VREVWEGFAITASEIACMKAAVSERRTGRRVDGSEYKALRTEIEESCTRAKNAERKDSCKKISMGVFTKDTIECTNQGLGIEPRRISESAKHTLDCCGPCHIVHIH